MIETNIKEYQQYVDKLRKEYIDNHTKEQERDELIGENNIEKRDIKGYHGREILELLQNADDAYQKSIDLSEKPDCELQVTIKYQNDVLTVTNTGTFFDAEGIKAIVQGNNSSKKGKYIGNKGTGFRSVLNWATRVRIFSGSFAVEFSKDIADELFEEIRNKPQIKKQLRKEPKLYIPMLAVPKNIENSKFVDETTIEIKINKDKINDDFSVMKQLENIDLRILLFLPNISQIDIVTEENHIIYSREKLGASIALQKFVDDMLRVEEEFLVFSKEIPNALTEDGEVKNVRLAIAIPKNYDNFHCENLYSFFPLLDTESPFNCAMHATYALSDQRNTVVPNQQNKEIFKMQIDFLLEIANKLVKNGMFESAYNLIVPSNFSNYNWKFVSAFSKFDLENYFLDSLCEQKLFCTVNNDLISINDNPKIFEEEFPDVFIGKPFFNLLKDMDDKYFQLIKFIKFLAYGKGLDISYKESELCDIINKISDKWTISQQTDVFIWWNSNFKNSLPQLLKTQDGKWLEYGKEYYFLVGNFDSNEIPSWVKIPAVNQEYQSELFNKSEQIEKVINVRERDKETHISRIICQNEIYPTIDFKYRDKSNIVPTVNSSVDAYDKAMDFVKWLWNSYGNDASWNPPGISDNVKYNFPTRKNKDVLDSEQFYFGAEYGNELAEKLFDESYSAFPAMPLFLIKKDDEEHFKSFIQKFGVKYYPEIVVQEVNPIQKYSQEYETIIEQYNNRAYSYRFKLSYIKNLEKILTNLSTDEVIQWVKNYSKLFSCLCNKYSPDSKILYDIPRHTNQEYGGSLKNYILEFFNESKWVEIGGKKYSPREILQTYDSKNNQKFETLVPLLKNETLHAYASKLKIPYDDVLSCLKLFEFRERVTDLTSENFYSLLLKLSKLKDLRFAEDLFRIIYRILENSEQSKKIKFGESAEKELYFSEGKMLAKYKGTLCLYSAKECFLPSQKIVNKNDFPIVEKGSRTDNEIFKNVFGCKIYSKDYSIDKNGITLSSADSKFQSYFSEFKKYARAFSERNSNIEKYGMKLQITLVSSINIIESDGEEKKVSDEYRCLQNSITDWYITVFGNEFDSMKISEQIENIYSNIANTPGFDESKIGELFRTSDIQTREFLITKEFGALSVIDDSNYQNEIKNKFINAIKTINASYPIEEINIDFDDFDNIKNIPQIISLFKELNIDIAEFEEAGFVYSINLKGYYESELTNFIQTNKRQFKDVLFSRAKTNNELQNSFIEAVSEFENFKLNDIPSTIHFNFLDAVISKFGDFLNVNAEFSADNEYESNYDKMNPTKLFEEEIANDTYVQTMIYFNQSKEFEEWLNKQDKLQENDKVKQINVYSQLEGVIPVQTEIAYNDTELDSNNVKSKSYSGVYSATKKQKQQEKQKLLGNKGEFIVYNLLCDKYGKENVYPKSEAYIELGMIKPGQASSGDYDISYKDENGDIHFVEVKTGNSNSFFISPSELEFAKANSDKYELYVVYDIDNEEPKYHALPHKFWENKKFRRNDIIERIEFKF